MRVSFVYVVKIMLGYQVLDEKFLQTGLKPQRNSVRGQSTVTRNFCVEVLEGHDFGSEKGRGLFGYFKKDHRF